MNNQMNFRALGGMVFSFARTARMKWRIFLGSRQEYGVPKMNLRWLTPVGFSFVRFSRKMNLTSPGRWFLKPLFGFLQKRVLMRIFVKNSPRKEYLLSLYNAREQVISESKVLRKIFLDGTEVLIIYPERFGLRISWDELYSELPSKSSGRKVEIWIQDRDFPHEENWGKVYRIEGGYLIRIKMPQVFLATEALSRLMNLKLLWGIGILSGLPEPDSYGKALNSKRKIILSSPDESRVGQPGRVVRLAL